MKKLLTLVLCSFMLLGSRAVAQESFTANVSAPGTLAEVLGDKANTIESLTVVGPLSAADINTLWSACWFGKLMDINLSKAPIEGNRLPDFAFWHFREQTEEPRNGSIKCPLRSIVLPDDIEVIGEDAFCCTKLSEIVLPPSVRELSSGSFYGCEDLVRINIPEGVSEIPAMCFRDCSSLSEFSCPSTLTSVGTSAFYYSGIEKIVLPENLRTIGDMAFSCSGLKTAHIPASCTEIGKAAFSLCRNLEEISFDGGLTEIPQDFAAVCMSLRRCAVPRGVTVIGKNAFGNCRALFELELPATLQDIHENAFISAGLSTLVMPSDVRNVGMYSFFNCPLTAIYSLADKPLANTAINSVHLGLAFNCASDIPVYVPVGAAKTYKETWGGWWNHFINFIEVDDVAAAGIDDAMQAGGVSVTARGGAIEVEGSGEFTVYSADGRAVASGIAPARVEAAPGLYIVRAGTSTVKLKI